MLEKLLAEKRNRLVTENKLLKFWAICLSVAIVIGFFMINSAIHSQKTIITYPDMEREIIVAGDDSNDEYFIRFAKYALYLAQNYHPSNFEHQANCLLKICTARYHPIQKDKLLKMADTISSLSISSVFYPQEVKIDRNLRIIKVTGMLFQDAQGSKMTAEHGDRKIYIVKYKIGNGRLLVDEIGEEKSKQAHG